VDQEAYSVGAPVSAVEEHITSVFVIESTIVDDSEYIKLP
jgi:hypothetical protein